MRILIFHGYLLSGTGSNVYNARLAEALRGLGHEVHLLCQERHPERHPFIDAVGEWEAGRLSLRTLASSERGGGPGTCTMYRPDIGPLLPVYVADRYEGIEARRFAECSDGEIAAYVEANLDAVAEVARATAPEAALANHLVMGPVVLARGLAGRVPFAVKVHGSALEYTVKPQPERFLAPAREGVEAAAGVLVGSRHTAESLWAALALEELPGRTRRGPPGVDVARFAPRAPAQAAAGVRTLANALLRRGEEDAAGGRNAPASAFARDPGEAGRALARLDAPREPLVAFVGKLIVSKGIDLLVAAWPLVLAKVPSARLLIVGFGSYRTAVEELIAALGRGDLAAVRGLAGRGREPEGLGDGRPLRHLLAFLDGLAGERRERYLAAARELPERVLLTGRLEHGELAEVLPACAAVVVPSTFPEAFGMVAAEAAACGALPISAAHSGLAEVSRELAGELPELASYLSFPVDDAAVESLAGRITGWLTAPAAEHARARPGLAGAVRERWSWQSVGRGVIAAAEGRLEELPAP